MRPRERTPPRGGRGVGASGPARRAPLPCSSRPSPRSWPCRCRRRRRPPASAGARLRCAPRSLAKSQASVTAPMSPTPISPPSPARWIWAPKGITALAAGDFDGLTALTGLSLVNNSLTTLPADVFGRADRADDPGAARQLSVHASRRGVRRADRADDPGAGDNSLSTLPAGVFDGLTALELRTCLWSTSLSTLPAGVFGVFDETDRADEVLTALDSVAGRQLSVHASRRGVRRADRADDPGSALQLSVHAGRRGVRRADRARFAASDGKLSDRRFPPGCSTN